MPAGAPDTAETPRRGVSKRPRPASSSNPSTNSPMILKTRHVSVSRKAALSAGPESSRSSWVFLRTGPPSSIDPLSTPPRARAHENGGATLAPPPTPRPEAGARGDRAHRETVVHLFRRGQGLGCLPRRPPGGGHSTDLGRRPLLVARAPARGRARAVAANPRNGHVRLTPDTSVAPSGNGSGPWGTPTRGVETSRRGVSTVSGAPAGMGGVYPCSDRAASGAFRRSR